MRVLITIYPEELAGLKKEAKDAGLPFSRYVVLKSLGKIQEH